MPVHVSWVDTSRTVILREFTGNWTWDEFYRSQDEARTMLDAVTYTVHQIFDFSHTQNLPPNALSHLSRSARNMPANRGKSIVITENNFYRQMYGLFARLFPTLNQRVVLVTNRDQAMEEALAANTTRIPG